MSNTIRGGVVSEPGRQVAIAGLPASAVASARMRDTQVPGSNTAASEILPEDERAADHNGYPVCSCSAVGDVAPDGALPKDRQPMMGPVRLAPVR